MIDITDLKALDASMEEFRKAMEDMERKEYIEATKAKKEEHAYNPEIERRIHRLLMENEKRCDEKRTWDSAVGVMVKEESNNA